MTVRDSSLEVSKGTYRVYRIQSKAVAASVTNEEGYMETAKFNQFTGAW